MKIECEVIRDLLPLYADDACSEKSRGIVEEHLQECDACREVLQKIRQTEIDDTLRYEKNSVIGYGAKQFRRRSALVGSAVSGAFMIPILVYLIVNIYSRSSLGVFFVVLASLMVAASLIIVPLMVLQDRLFWTFCAFCASLMILLAVVCLYSRGTWFWIASSASLFGLSVVFLPFVVRSRPVKRLIGGSSRLLIVLVTDAALFVNMMNMISSHGKITLSSLVFTIGVAAGIGVVVSEIVRKRGDRE